MGRTATSGEIVANKPLGYDTLKLNGVVRIIEHISICKQVLIGLKVRTIQAMMTSDWWLVAKAPV